MKAKEFEIGKGEFAIQATFTNYNDATESEESTTIRTHERPRPKLYTDAATVALYARKYWDFEAKELHVSKISFSENDDGQFARVTLYTLSGIKILPPKVKRSPYTAPGEDKPDPEHPLNLFLEAINQLENRISEYLNGDREQPDLPMAPEAEPEARPKQGYLLGKIQEGIKRTTRKKAGATA